MAAARLKQLQSKACQATQFVSKHGSTYYKQLLEQNKQYIQEPPTVEKCSELSKQLFYTRLARFILLSHGFLATLFNSNLIGCGRGWVIKFCLKIKIDIIVPYFIIYTCILYGAGCFDFSFGGKACKFCDLLRK